MIELKSINKSFEDKQVLNNVNCLFENSKTNLIIGRSGSGKTVLMNCIVGLIQPDSGEIRYDGKNMLSFSKQETFQLRRHSYKDRMRRAQFCLDRVNLSDAGNKLPGELSGGMQKRAAIARAISMQPKYLFCDEPNSGLDPKTSIVIDKLIQEITRENEMTTIINTHDMNSVMGIGENIVFLYHGEKEWQGSKDDIMSSPNKRLNDFIFASDFSKRLREVNEE